MGRMEAVGVVVTVGLIVAVGATDRQTDRKTDPEQKKVSTHTRLYEDY